MSGGATLGDVIGKGGIEYLFQGGISSKTTLLSGGSIYFEGGTAENLTVSNGAKEYLQTSGSLILSSGMFAPDISIIEGTLIVAGGEVGKLTPEFHGLAIGVTVASGGVLSSQKIGDFVDFRVLSGGRTVDITVSGSESGETVFSGGVAIGTTLGGRSNFPNGAMLRVSGGTASQTKITRSASEIVFAGGKAFAATVSAGGEEVVSSGGMATGAVLLAGGTQSVLSKGKAFGTEVSSGGIEIISAGAKAVGTVVHSGGTLDLAGGTSGNIGSTEFEAGANLLIGSGGRYSQQRAEISLPMLPSVNSAP